jgi:diguanylate cyclase (GGDEF)-like protein
VTAYTCGVLVPSGQAAQPVTAASIDHARASTTRDVDEMSVGVRGIVIRSTLAAYVIAMVALTALASGAPDVDPGMRLGVVVAGGGTATILARLLLERSLRRVDDLRRRTLELTDLYDMARVDALRDPLTGLGNHRAFQEELDRAAQMARRHGQSTALLLLDVDDLKRTNDVHGHEAGDEMLQTVGRVVSANLRRTDRAFRIGGDEFAILSPGTTVEGAVTFGRRILAGTLDTQQQPGRRSVSLTIGISAIPDPSPDRNLLYRHADAALYWGKRHGRTDIRAYDPALHGIADDDRPAAELAASIDRVVEERLLRPAYQPVCSLTDGTCLGYEGLVRPRADSGFRNPSAMFIAAESVSRTVELDLAAVREIAAGARDLTPERYLTVNLSPRTVEAAAFNPHEIIAIFGSAGIGPGRLVVELTEREAVEDIDQLARGLRILRRAGVRIAADDVGAGNAGLRLLSQIDFDVIKIDMSLIRTEAFLAPSQAVLRALIDMAQRRGATTVAEGIETPAQLRSLRQLGVNVGQGYLLGMPQDLPVGGDVDLDAMGSLDDEGDPLEHATLRVA